MNYNNTITDCVQFYYTKTKNFQVVSSAIIFCFLISYKTLTLDILYEIISLLLLFTTL